MLWKTFRKVLAWLHTRPHPAPPISMVLLLRSSHRFPPETLEFAARRGWRIESPHVAELSVNTAGITTLVKIGSHLISVLSAAQPYLGDPKVIAPKLPQESQREAWAKHTAWVALDYLNGEDDLELAYCVLCRLTAELINSNCVGVYAPREESFAPYSELLAGDLQRVADSRLARTAHENAES
jgi:hypothetical protein